MLIGAMSSTASAQFVGFGPRIDIDLGPQFPSDSVAVDLDHDGDIDLAFPLLQTGTFDQVVVLLNNGDGTFGAPAYYNVGGGPRAIAAADVDLDGDIDLAVANNDSGDCSVLRNNGNGTFLPEVFFSVGSGPRDLAIVDVDSDGRADIVCANFDDDSVTVVLGDGSGTSWTVDSTLTTTNGSGSLGNGPASILVTDLNADSHPDIVTANAFSNTCTVMYNIAGNPGNFFFGEFALFVETGSNPADVKAGDVDRDGDPDLIIANRNSSTVSTRLSNLTTGVVFPSFTGGLDISVPAAPIGMALVDFDDALTLADGDIDLVVSCENADQIAVLLNNGSGGYTIHSTYETLGSPEDPSAADFDGDGDTDVAVPSLHADAVSLFFNQSTVVGGEPPFVELISPTENGCVCAGNNPIIGTVNPASGTVLNSYLLEYRRLGNPSFTTIASGESAVINDVLANWNSIALSEGRYILKLSASNTGGISASVEIVVLVETQMDIVNALMASGVDPSTSTPVIGQVGCIYGTIDDYYSCGSVTYTVDYRPISGGSFIPVDPLNPVHAGERINQVLAHWDTIGSGIPDGPYEIRTRGINACDHINEVTFPVTVDNTPPTAQITTPTPCSYYTPGEVINVLGTAEDTNLASWTLQYTGGDSSGWVTIASGASSVVNASLGVWDTAGLRPCAYTLRLVTIDEAVLNCNNSSRHRTDYMVSIDLRCPPDLNEDGMLDFFDVSAFLQSFSAGCD